ncbi:hypothetical protein ILUMI_09028 [Ignelater luminosus]|uniref:Uncharacterized protein n=1 Tax=Ignelater luminosus TaxID=2038154 RepID=A0A8K0GEX1_IGNLU|nr:hypothetical protein ILUMI_09028 [Ignelater luminosus]
MTTARIRRLQAKMYVFGKPPIEERGKHQNRPTVLPEAVTNLIECHIRSFKARQSHYSIRKNPNRYYLPETLSVNKMYQLFVQEYKIQISCKVYWPIFTNNLKFGLPRINTCTKCDSLMQKVAAAENEELRRKLEIEKEIHLRKVETEGKAGKRNGSVF